jgi:septal ring-binding cell division protein DamX
MLARAQADASHRIEKDWLSKAMGLISSTPDTSATLFGPVHIGKSGNGIETPGQPAVAPVNATIQASPVSEKNLEPTKPAEATTPASVDSGKAKENTTEQTPPEAAKPATPEDDSAKAKEGAAGQAQTETASPAAPAKKKGRFHVLKKVVKPF